MKIIDKVCGKIGLMNTDEMTEGKGEEMMPEEGKTAGRPEETPHNVVDFQSSAASIRETVATAKMKVIVIEPKSFDDAQQVANCLKEKRPVVINFENTEGEAAKRIIDFISGTTYALGGEIKKVGRNVFLCAPSNVNVAYTQEQKTVSAEMPWLKQ